MGIGPPDAIRRVPIGPIDSCPETRPPHGGGALGQPPLPPEHPLTRVGGLQRPSRLVPWTTLSLAPVSAARSHSKRAHRVVSVHTATATTAAGRTVLRSSPGWGMRESSLFVFCRVLNAIKINEPIIPKAPRISVSPSQPSPDVCLSLLRHDPGETLTAALGR